MPCQRVPGGQGFSFHQKRHLVQKRSCKHLCVVLKRSLRTKTAAAADVHRAGAHDTALKQLRQRRCVVIEHRLIANLHEVEIEKPRRIDVASPPHLHIEQPQRTGNERTSTHEISVKRSHTDWNRYPGPVRSARRKWTRAGARPL
jgi:hypothetical protein